MVNYLIDLLTRSGYLLDKQINAIEDKHQREGGYNENLLKKRRCKVKLHRKQRSLTAPTLTTSLA